VPLCFFGGNYEDFIEDHTKRDGRDGLDLTLGIRHSNPDIDRPVHGAGSTLIRNSCALVADPARIEIKIDSQLSSPTNR
jgi:hypothetical protein